MKRASLVLGSLAFLSACGSGEDNASVVQAATKAAGELGEQVAEKATVLAQKAAEAAALKGEEARVKLQELVDEASLELAAARDSETVQAALVELDQALVQLAELVKALGAKLDLERLRLALGEALERFRNDPDVQRASESLRAKLDAWTAPAEPDAAQSARTNSESR